jgi:hypothetical protein
MALTSPADGAEGRQSCKHSTLHTTSKVARPPPLDAADAVGSPSGTKQVVNTQSVTRTLLLLLLVVVLVVVAAGKLLPTITVGFAAAASSAAL